VSLRHALLGLLAEQPLSGYELTKRFTAPAHVWSAKHSQIYPELARLQQTGLIRQVQAGPRGKKTYAITDEGRAEVRRWLKTPPGRTSRDEAFLRVFFLWLAGPEDAREYLRGELDYHKELLDHYETLNEEAAPSSPAEQWTWIALQAGIRHERALIEWAEWALDQVPISGLPAGGRKGRPSHGDPDRQPVH
jgi:PadR family transcriptional regulator, regulatory protein AphA